MRIYLIEALETIATYPYLPLVRSFICAPEILVLQRVLRRQSLLGIILEQRREKLETFLAWRLVWWIMGVPDAVVVPRLQAAGMRRSIRCRR